MKLVKKLALAVASACLLILCCIAPSLAAPPVRIAVVAGNASGQEQEVADRISDQIQNNPNIRVSTVNPDWYVVVSINDKTDLMSSNVRVNGTVTIKTTDGHIIATRSAQSNKQDFNLTPGSPTPVNRVLVDSAIKEVINGLVEGSINPLQDAVEVEIATRDKIIAASGLADDDKYDQAIESLQTIAPDTPHFKAVRELIAEFRMEQHALDLMNEAKDDVKHGQLRAAIVQLKGIDPRSKRAKAAKAMVAELQRVLAARPARKPMHPAAASGAGTDKQLQALEAQKKALDAQKKAIDAQETALKSKTK